MTTTYRTRPRTIEAMRYAPSDPAQCQAMHDRLGIEHRTSEHSPEATLEFADHEGRFIVLRPGNWVIWDGVHTSILSDQEFSATYEPVTGDAR